MKIFQITQILEEWAPLHYAEDFDNVGLLVGNQMMTSAGYSSPMIVWNKWLMKPLREIAVSLFVFIQFCSKDSKGLLETPTW